jgi:hypothetical protein
MCCEAYALCRRSSRVPKTVIITVGLDTRQEVAPRLQSANPRQRCLIDQKEHLMTVQPDRTSQMIWGLLAIVGAVLAVVGIYRYLAP